MKNAIQEQIIAINFIQVKFKSKSNVHNYNVQIVSVYTDWPIRKKSNGMFQPIRCRISHEMEMNGSHIL